jgi:hypothetical protein
MATCDQRLAMALELHEGRASTEAIVMKASKLIVLVGGILGILAFFLPLVSVHRADFKGTASAFQIVKGLDQVSHEVDREADRAAARAEAPSLEVDKAKDGIGQIKGLVLAIFAPAALLALIGGLGVARKKFGRGAGALSLVFGLIGLGIAALLKSAAEGDAGIGLTLLLVTGITGVVGGILALAKPERQPALAPA